MGPVQAVIPNTPETERLILMMNKNVPSYVGNVLKDQGMPEAFLMELVRRTASSWKRHHGLRMPSQI